MHNYQPMRRDRPIDRSTDEVAAINAFPFSYLENLTLKKNSYSDNFENCRSVVEKLNSENSPILRGFCKTLRSAAKDSDRDCGKRKRFFAISIKRKLQLYTRERARACENKAEKATSPHARGVVRVRARNGRAQSFLIISFHRRGSRIVIGYANGRRGNTAMSVAFLCR